ncbi:MAG: glycosyltransferase family 39 protein, partial [Candidatus Omnitrophica bacterium]|nr:glycosyltransferase family 39 protein [Candidatus Omnitrophota bacterium]
IDRHKISLSLLILILAGIFYSAGLNNILGMNEDDAIYVMMADSMLPGKADSYSDQHTKSMINNYPHGFPALLAPLVHFFPKNYYVLRLLTFILSLIFVFFIFYIPKALFKDEFTVFVIPLIALSPQIVYYSAEFRTEIPYILFSTIAIYLISRYADINSSKKFVYLLAGTLAVFISYYIRLVGLALIISIPVFFLLRKEFKKSVICFIIVLVFAVFWVVSNVFLRRLPYVSEFALRTGNLFGFVHRWFYNLAATIGKELPDLYSYPFLSFIDPYDKIFIIKFAIGCLLALLIAVGFIVKVRKEGLGLMDVYSVIYFFVFCLSWTHHGGRYVMPILFFITYYLILGIKRVMPKKKMVYVVLFFMLLLNIAGDIRWLIVKRKPFFTPVEMSFLQAADWVKKNTPEKSIILSRRPAWLFVYADRRRVRTFIRTKDTKIQYQYIQGNKVDYVIIDAGRIYRDSSRDYLLPLVSAYKDKFEMVYESDIEPKTYIYRVKG